VTYSQKPLAIATLAFALCCSSSKQEPTPKATVPSAAVPAKPAPASPSTEPAPPAAKPAPPVLATALPPLKVVQGDGITITEIADGSVSLKTTSLWNEAFDTTYQTCEYYRGAIPVLKRQLSKDRATLLDQACVKDKKKKK
jgi:hypothetical protein